MRIAVIILIFLGAGSSAVLGVLLGEGLVDFNSVPFEWHYYNRPQVEDLGS